MNREGRQIEATAQIRGDIQGVAAGYDHSLALTRYGRVLAFGHNNKGQLGDGTSVDHELPSSILADAAMGSFVSVAAGEKFSLALNRRGEVWSWGLNDRLQLGVKTEGNNQPALSPILTWDGGGVPARAIVQISAGRAHVLALTSGGGVISWGRNSLGQLGRVETTDLPPGEVDFSELHDGERVLRVEAGHETSLAMTSEGRVFAWGDNGKLQALGVEGGSGKIILPTLVELPAGAVFAVGAGSVHAAALVPPEGGAGVARILTWGTEDNTSKGVLGDSEAASTGMTQALWSEESGAGPAALSVQQNLSVARLEDRSLVSWGSNAKGQCGVRKKSNATDIFQPEVVRLLGSGERLRGIDQVSAGGEHVLAVDRLGHVWAWGNNSHGQLGIPKDLLGSAYGAIRIL